VTILRLLSLIFGTAVAVPADAACREQESRAARYVVCAFDAADDDIRLFLAGDDETPFGDFEPLRAALASKGERLLFAMNAGMYDRAQSPVGLYVEGGEALKPLSTADGPGNFHLKPNGVFSVRRDGGRRRAQIVTSEGYRDRMAPDAVRYATQSGPMLVIDGAVHPRFLVDATSRKRRNGVGVAEDGERVVFVLADTPVTFHEFATFFRDALRLPDALYLDGTISRLYAPELGRNDPGAPMGPIVGVVAPLPHGDAQ
jgi:uncharacterized protein YigE (DUF2233 family)